jgi:ubiquinone/menaquinone biosynthesis C-methylase UbiE
MPRNYDFVAPFYPMLERAAFGEGLTEARRASLSPVVSAERALLIGEGNGRFLATCLEEKIGGSITVVESSGKMLSLLRARIQQIALRTKLEIVHADFCEWSPVALPFDIIVTHFFLDLFRPVSQRRVIEKITALSDAKTIWVNVDFRPVIQSSLHRWIDWLQYRFDGLLSGIEADRHYDCAPIIADFGWQIQKERPFCRGTICSQLLAAPVPG